MGLILNAKSIGESTCTIKSVEELQRLLLEIDAAQIERYFGLKVAVPDYNDEAISLIGQIAAKVRQKGSDIEVFVNSMEMEFDMSEIERFIELEDAFDKKNIGLYFEGGLENYTLADTLYAQLQINDIVEQINQTKASPFEKYLMAYEFITSRVYKEYEEGSARSRDLIAVLTGDNIVCVGYAKLMDRLCKGIGIESFFQPVRVFDDKGNALGGHQNNIIYLKDDKYGIDGYYYTDSCWDAVFEAGQHKRFLNHCLLPLSDKDNFKNTKIEIGAYREIKGVKATNFYQKIPSKYDLSKTLEKSSFKTAYPDEAEFASTAADLTVLDSKKRSLACGKLRKALAIENIPANVYGDELDEIKLVSPECSYEYMLAILLDDQSNKKEIASCVSSLKNYAMGIERGLSERNTILRTPTDIYEKIAELSAGINTKNFGSENGYSSPFEWRRVKEQLEILKMSEFAVERIKQTVKPGKPISIENYMVALKNIFLMKGLDEKAAEYQTGLIIDSSIRNSEFIFTENATNAFRQEALSRRIEQGSAMGE